MLYCPCHRTLTRAAFTSVICSYVASGGTAILLSAPLTRCTITGLAIVFL